jgi:hypothetical protein
VRDAGLNRCSHTRPASTSYTHQRGLEPDAALGEKIKSQTMPEQKKPDAHFDAAADKAAAAAQSLEDRKAAVRTNLPSPLLPSSHALSVSHARSSPIGLFTHLRSSVVASRGDAAELKVAFERTRDDECQQGKKVIRNRSVCICCWSAPPPPLRAPPSVKTREGVVTHRTRCSRRSWERRGGSESSPRS